MSGRAPTVSALINVLANDLGLLWKEPVSVAALLGP